MIAIYVCKTCKFAGEEECACHQGEWHFMGTKWRIPKRNNKRAWARIAAGELWWDRKAIAKKAQAQAERTRLYLLYLKAKK